MLMIFGDMYILEIQEDNNNPESITRKILFSYPGLVRSIINGRVFMCCATWLPFEIGNILDNHLMNYGMV